MLDIFASRFEFEHRTWFIFGIFCVGLVCYWIDPQVSGVVLARSLRLHMPFLQTLNPQTGIRAVFLAGAFVVTTHTPHSFVTHEVLLELFAFGMRADLATIGMAPNV